MNKKWSIIFLHKGKMIDVVTSEGKNHDEAYRNLPDFRKPSRVAFDYRVEPFPKRLYVRDQNKLTFEVSGFENENGLPFVMHELINGVGFEYLPIYEIDEYLEEMAPIMIVKKISKITNRILNEIQIQPKSITISLKDNNCFGSGGNARAITSIDGIVYIELELSAEYPLTEIDYWERMLWHEFMHVRYTLERRWPSIWPFYIKNIEPLRILDDVAHFSIDGWLEKNNKPTIKFSTDDPKISDLKAFRLSQLRDDLELDGHAVPEKYLKPIAENLWYRDTNIHEANQIMQNLGSVIPEDTALDKYLKGSKTIP
jgi:hypothetical protein